MPSGLSHIPPYVAVGGKPCSHTPCCGVPSILEIKMPSISSVSRYRKTLTLLYVFTTLRPVRYDPLLCVRHSSTVCLSHISTVSLVWNWSLTPLYPCIGHRSCRCWTARWKDSRYSGCRPCSTLGDRSEERRVGKESRGVESEDRSDGGEEVARCRTWTTT